jgi:MOSC domain-containing protein YiiM
MGSIVSIWIKRSHSGAMDRVGEAQLVAGRGLVGNADQGRRRQITLIDEGAWAEALLELDADVEPSARRANILLRGVDLLDSRGKILRLGACTVQIFGETRPCHLMDEMHAGLRNALSAPWRGGAFGEILEGGAIRVGDTAEWISLNAERRMKNLE